MSDLVNSTVGDYRLEEFLGAGGMGEVYRGVHTKIGRVAAIKILTASSDPGFTDRFLNEARIQAELHHPNIATLYEFTELAGRPCIIMEYVDGVTLADRIRVSTQIRPPEAVGIFLSVVEAVGYIHTSGIIHRDIKSHNIKISSNGTVKLLDFGIAQGSHTPRLTRAGQFVGTLHYCSPEQLRGDPVDHRSDIWALGILMYEMLTGKVPFDAPSAGEFIARVEKATPRPPSELVPEIPPPFDALVGRCLEKRPGRRFQSAAELAQASAGAGERHQRQPRRSSHLDQLPAAMGSLTKVVREHPVVALVSAAVLLAVVAGLAVLPGLQPSPRAPSDRTRPAAVQPPQGHTTPVSIGVVGGRAEVWVDGRNAGSTPCRFEAAVGDKIKLELRVKDRQSIRRTIEVLPHSNNYTYSMRDFKPR